MLRCLVRTEDDKKERFRKLIHKRIEERRKHDLSNHHLFACMPPLERIRPIQPNISIFTNNKSDNENCPSLTSNQPSDFSEQNEKTNRNKFWSSNQEELALPPYMGKFETKDLINADRNENMPRRNMCVNNINKWNDFTQNKNTMIRYFYTKIVPHIRKCYKDPMKPVSRPHYSDIGLANIKIDPKKKIEDNMARNVARNVAEAAHCWSKESLIASSYVHKKFGLTTNYLSSELQNTENKNR